MSIDYAISSVSSDGDFSDPDLTLNGLGIRDQVLGSATIPGGQTHEVTVNVSVDQFQGFGMEQLLLSADVDGDGVYEAIGSRTLQPTPGGLAGVPGLGPLALGTLALLLACVGRESKRLRAAMRRIGSGSG